MDIAALSSAMSYSQLHMNVGYALTAKVMDQVEETSMELLEMLEGAIPSDLGQFVDIRAAKGCALASFMLFLYKWIFWI